METLEYPVFSISPARYAKGMMAVCCKGDGSGYKDRAMCLAAYFARDRYTGRENAYIMSPAAARKFVEHYKKGFDASCIERRLIQPREESK